MKVVQTLLDALFHHSIDLVFRRLRVLLIAAAVLLRFCRSIQGVLGEGDSLLAIAFAFALAFAFATVALTRLVCLRVLGLPSLL